MALFQFKLLWILLANYWKIGLLLISTSGHTGNCNGPPESFTKHESAVDAVEVLLDLLGHGLFHELPRMNWAKKKAGFLQPVFKNGSTEIKLQTFNCVQYTYV